MRSKPHGWERDVTEDNSTKRLAYEVKMMLSSVASHGPAALTTTSDPMYTARLLARLRDALEASDKEMHARELHRFETEQIAQNLRDKIEEARNAWWSATEQGDSGLIYNDRIEDAMDDIWSAIGHADWTPESNDL